MNGFIGDIGYGIRGNIGYGDPVIGDANEEWIGDGPESELDESSLSPSPSPSSLLVFLSSLVVVEFVEAAVAISMTRIALNKKVTIKIFVSIF